MAANERKAIVQLLRNHFDESELRDLCFDLQINYEDLPGQSRRDKTRELVTFCQRRRQLPELVEACRQLRPNVSWPYVAFAPESQAEVGPLIPESVFRRVRSRAWLAAGSLLIVAVLFSLWRLGGQDGAQEPAAVASPEQDSAAATASPRTLAASNHTTEGARQEVALGETVTGRLIGAAEDVWHFAGGPAMVDIIVQSAARNNPVLLVFGPDNEQPLAYVDYLAESEGEELRFFDIPDDGNYQIVVQDLSGAGGVYNLTVKHAQPGRIGLEEIVSGTLIGANPAVWTFSGGPATVVITLHVGPGDSGALALHAPDGRRLSYVDGGTDGEVRLREDIPDDGEYAIVVFDTNNDGADYTLTVEGTTADP